MHSKRNGYVVLGLLGWVWISLLALGTGCRTAAPPPPTPTPEPVVVRFSGLPVGQGYQLDTELIAQFTAETGIQVEFVPGPELATERLALYKELLEQGDSTLDVYQIDVIWPGTLAPHLLDLAPHLGTEAADHFPTIIANNTVDGRLVGMPYYTDAGLLFYRTDLLRKYEYAAPPRTWDELEAMALVIQEGERLEGNLTFWGFVWQGAPNEGLTCNALEWQASAGGGTIVNGDGWVSVNNRPTIAALQRAAGWVGTISPPEVIGHTSEDSRSVWQAGNAAFMRNWPYAYALGQQDGSIIRGQFGVTMLPNGGVRHADTLGGWQLAVSQYSAHPEAAIALVRYLTSPEVQAQRSIRGSYLPTIPALYDDPAILAANPFYVDLQSVFVDGAVARPSAVTGAKYSDVSRAYFTAVHEVLTGETTAVEAMSALETRLSEILETSATTP